MGASAGGGTLTSGVAASGATAETAGVRRAAIPLELRRGPFTVQDARRAGLTRRQLHGRAWVRIAPRTYVWAGLTEGRRALYDAALRRSPPRAVLSGWSAADLHGLDVDDECGPELIASPGSGVSALVGVRLWRGVLDDRDVVVRHRRRLTSVPRTLRDLTARVDLVEGIALVDQALYRQLTTLPELDDWVAEHSGSIGVPKLRRALEHAEPLSESPMETRLRMLLVLAGLPRPQAQATLFDAGGSFLARADLYYPAQRLAIEYDGGTHRDSLAEDDRRQNRLVAAGIQLLRFTAGDVYGRPAAVAAEVGAALKRAA